MRIMTRRVAWLAAVLISAVSLIAQDQAADELEKLQGVWTVTAAEQRGRPFDAIKGGALTMAERSFVLKTAAGNEFTGEVRIHPSATPRQLDFVHADDGPVWEAIYSVTEDVLRLNYVEGGGSDKRPTLFATSADTAGTVIVLRRVATLAPAQD
jgi:uncharacterized protein (TIGR03067 family)